MGEIAGKAVASGAGLYEMMHGGHGTWTLDRAHEVADRHARLQGQFGDEVAAIASEIDAAWTGRAAEGAQDATGPLRQGARRSAEALEHARRVHSDQGGQFVHARDKMEKLPATAPETNVIDSLTPWDTDTEDAVNRYNQQSARNVELYSAYGATTTVNESSMPRDYGSFPEFGGHFTVTEAHGPDGGTQASSSYAPHIGGGGGAGGIGGGVPGPGGGHSGVQQPPPSTGGGAVVGPGGGVSSGGTGGAGPTGGTGSPGGTAAGAPRPGVSGFGPEGLLGAGAAAGGGEDTVRGGRGAGRGAGGRPGGGVVDAEAGARNAAAAERAAGRSLAGGRVGAGPGAAAAAEAATARGVSSGARAGAGPLGAGSGKKEEDREHKRRTVLEEVDTESTFGVTERTPPSVIGEQR